MDEFKKVAIEAVKKAEERIVFYFHNQPDIQKKADLTPVTLADKEAEQIIFDTIKYKFPNHGFIGEESGDYNKDAEFVWILDPIDGTKSFVHRLPFFGTVLGLKKGEDVILGVSNMPIVKETLFASNEEETTLNGKPTRVSQINSLEDAFVNVGSIGKEKFANVLARLRKEVQAFKGYADLYGYHLVATGRAEAMLEADVKPWDISAFEIIIKQAGGKYSNLSGEKTLGPDSLASNGLLHEPILNLLKEVNYKWEKSDMLE